MKSLLNIINEKLIINKHSKTKSLAILSFNEFKDLIKNDIKYLLQYEDFITFRNCYVKIENKHITDAKFIDITNDDKEWEFYDEKIPKGNEFVKHYLIKNIKSVGYLFHYINTDTDTNSYTSYRIGYIIGEVNDNIKNRNNTRIFKIQF